MNIEKIRSILAQRIGKEPKSYTDTELASLADYLAENETADYLRNCLPAKIIDASGVRVLPLDAIEKEMAEGAAPGSFIRKFGHLVVATSVGGNAICFHSPSGKVFWADHTSFSARTISFKDRAVGQWKYLYEYTPENVEKALIPLSDDIEEFLDNLYADRLKSQLDAMD